MPKETYPKARERLFKELPALGYRVVLRNMAHTLKVPYVFSPKGRQYWFHPQSVHGEGGLSLWIDIRGMSADGFHRNVLEYEKR